MKNLQILRQAYRSFETARLAATRHQGKTFYSFSLSKASIHYNRKGRFIQFAEWMFIHRARLADVPINGYKHDRLDAEMVCRWCHKQVETLSHVLNHYHQFMPAVTRRHNNENRIKKAAEKENKYAPSVNEFRGKYKSVRPEAIVFGSLGPGIP